MRTKLIAFIREVIWPCTAGLAIPAVFLFAVLLISACQPSKLQLQSKTCSVSGNLNWKHSDPALVSGLCRMSRELGPVFVHGRAKHGNCRTRGTNKSVSGSYHLYTKGCRAADITVKGVSGGTVLRWWRDKIGGGRGFYCKRGFVHVDVGPNRTWAWYCGKKRNSSIKRKI